MTNTEIKENFVKGSQAYLQYLVDNDLGIEKINATSVITLSEGDVFLYLIKASRRIFDETALEFEIRGKRYNESHIHILKNDKRDFSLTIQAEKSIAHEFMGITKDDITIIADMKFLVARVMNWYENYGNLIEMPEYAPKIKPYFPDSEISKCQKNAINTIFKKPLSYIWGAPGTGKTGYVLANSILSYLKNDENDGIILLTAPTNAALEQTLYRLLPILSDNGIDLNKIMRLGYPSRQFSAEYPNVCENTGLQHEAEKIKETMDIYRRYISILKKKRNCDALKMMYPKLNFENAEEELTILNERLKEIQKSSLPARIEKELSVIACTVDTYIGRCLNSVIGRSKRSISHIFLDEACYCNLAKALTLFSCKCPITFLGDHMQLPPVCEISDEALMSEKNTPAFIWSQSAIYAENVFYEDILQMYEEYVRNSPPHFDYMTKSDLNFTHRFGSGLTEVLERHVYQNNFMSAVFTETEIICINVTGNHFQNKRENIGEVRAIENYIKAEKLDDYVILTPYRNQEKRLFDRLKRNVMTVHKSQGQEWETVILSITDTNNKYFTDSLNKESKGLQLINTAVSRAKNRLVIVCDAVFWQKQEGQLIKDLIEISQIK